MVFLCGSPDHFIKDCTDPRFRTRAEQFKKNGSNKATDLKTAGYIAYITDGMADEYTDNATMSLMGKGTCRANVWLSNSGCNRHITCTREYFATYEEFPHAKAVKGGNNSSVPAYSKGIIYVEMFVNEDCILCYIEDVWYVPDFSPTSSLLELAWIKAIRRRLMPGKLPS